MGYAFGAATAGHVFVSRAFNETGCDQCLANATRGSVPSSTGAAGYEKVDVPHAGLGILRFALACKTGTTRESQYHC